jgi:hypothetical protein
VIDSEALLVVGAAVLILGAVLAFVAFFAARGAVRRERARNHIRVTRLGICFGVAQALAMFSVVGWGFFHPETFLGRVVEHDTGVLAIIAITSLACMPVHYALQRAGVVLFYRSQGGG